MLLYLSISHFKRTSLLFLKISALKFIMSFTNAILEEAEVALVTGAGFGAPENIRLSYATDLDTLKEAVRRIKAFMEK